MLWTIFLVLVVLWMLGVVSSYTLGGFIHVLLVLAIVALLVQLIQAGGSSSRERRLVWINKRSFRKCLRARPSVRASRFCS